MESRESRSLSYPASCRIRVRTSPGVEADAAKRSGHYERQATEVNNYRPAGDEPSAARRYAWPSSQLNLDPAVKDPPFRVRVNLAESRALMRREDDRPETALPGVGDVFGVDEQADLAVTLFAENPQHPV